MKVRYSQHTLITAVLLTVVSIFSMWLMFHTFSYDTRNSHIQIGSKLWSDFGAHIPLIRSFSKGPNLYRLTHLQAIESPLFPKEPIRYHFGFYAIVGILEKLGIRIDWALNIMSAIGLSGLIISIYYCSFALFKRHSISLLSILFFLFNGSLSFLSFFKNHPLSFMSPIDIMTNSKFPAFGPWDNGSITAFWTLNIYTNQRHLALSYAILIYVLYALYTPFKTGKYTHILVALLIAFLLGINFAVAGIAAIFLTWIFCSQKHTRLNLLPTIGMGLAAYALLGHISNVTSTITWHPGYLIQETVTPSSFIQFWAQNIGLHIILIPLGLMLAPKPIKRYIGPPLLLLFIIPNLYQFSPDMINNHKFFNFFLILGNMFSSYAIVHIIQHISKLPIQTLVKPLQFLVGGICIGSLTLSGIIDVFPIINDTKGNISDVQVNADSAFIQTHTKQTDIIANSTWFYHPASIAGRSLFSGYTYFTWSYGYDQSRQEAILLRLYRASTIHDACQILTDNEISWVELNTSPESYVQPNWNMWNTLSHEYQNINTHVTLYKTDTICSQ